MTTATLLSAAILFALACVVLAAVVPVGAGFALAGAWMVLPFAGLELALLFIVLRSLRQRAASYKSIRFDGDRLIVASSLSGRQARHAFPIAWARVSLEAEGGAEPLLCIRSHGRSVCVGQLMTLPQRRRLAAELATRLQH